MCGGLVQSTHIFYHLYRKDVFSYRTPPNLRLLAKKGGSTKWK